MIKFSKKMNTKLHIPIIITLTLFFSLSLKGQDSLKVYLNAGYITNIQKCDECTQADTGGSIRVGLLTKKWYGFYLGYIWFNEYHSNYIEYDDRGKGVLFGLDVRILEKNDFRANIKAGLFIEKFISEYANRTESETSIKPDFGLLLNYKYLNFLLAWQPSEPHHINLGIGFTFDF